MRDIVKEYQKKFRRNHQRARTLYCAAAGTGAYHQPVRELAAARRGHCQNGRISVR